MGFNDKSPSGLSRKPSNSEAREHEGDQFTPLPKHNLTEMNDSAEDENEHQQ